MSKFFILIGISTLFVLTGFSQSEIKIYGGYLDYLGISYEYTSINKLSIELGASFRSKSGLTRWHGFEVRDNNLFINGMFKKYHSNKKGKTNFFYGAYIRYWQSHNYAVNANKSPLSTSLQSLLDSDQTVTYATKTHKISFGLLTGYKLPIGEIITFGINTGIGFSPSLTYWQIEYRYYQPDVVSLYGDDAWFGYLNHLSLIGNLSVGYRFNKKE